MRSVRSTLLAVATAIVIAACGDGDGDKSEPRILDSREIAQIVDLATIDPDDKQGFNSIVEALVSYELRPLQIEGETSEVRGGGRTVRSGTVLFAKCPEGETMQSCVGTTPTGSSPFVYVPVSWMTSSDTGERVSANSPKEYVAQVTATQRLSCNSRDSFQLNPYTITRVPTVFTAFTKDGKGVSGDMEVDFGSEKQEHYPPQGKVIWHCEATATPATSFPPVRPASPSPTATQ